MVSWHVCLQRCIYYCHETKLSIPDVVQLPIFLFLWRIPLFNSHKTRQVPNCQIFWIFRGYLWKYEFLQLIICYCSSTRTVQLISRVFHLGISFVCRFRVIRIIFCVFWRFRAEEVNGMRAKVSGDTTVVDARRPFWTSPWDQPIVFMMLFSGIK
jgi:hypothetical protein